MTAKTKNRTASGSRKHTGQTLLEREAGKRLKFDPSLIHQWGLAIERTKRRLAAGGSEDSGLPWHEDTALARAHCAENLVRHVHGYAGDWAALDAQQKDVLRAELDQLPFEAQCRKLNRKWHVMKLPSEISDELLAEVVARCPRGFTKMLLACVPVFRHYIERFTPNDRAEVRRALLKKLNRLTPTEKVFSLIDIVGSTTNLREVIEYAPFRPWHVREYRAMRWNGRERKIIAKHCKNQPQCVRDCLAQVVVELFDSPGGEGLRTRLQWLHAKDAARLKRFLNAFLDLVVKGERSVKVPISGLSVRAVVRNKQHLPLPPRPAAGSVQTLKVFTGTITPSVVQDMAWKAAHSRASRGHFAKVELFSIAREMAERAPLLGSILFVFMVSPTVLLNCLSDLLATPAHAGEEDRSLMAREWPEVKALPEKLVEDRLAELRSTPDTGSKNAAERVARSRRRFALTLADPKRRARGSPR